MATQYDMRLQLTGGDPATLKDIETWFLDARQDGATDWTTVDALVDEDDGEIWLRVVVGDPEREMKPPRRARARRS